MAIDISRQGSKGGDPKYDTSQLRGVREERGIVKGIVKANVHGAHMGVIRVWIPTFSTNPADKSQWRTVRYCTPFYSRVDSQGPRNNYMSTKVTSGIVTPPPDIGTQVLCFFPEGRNAEGYYFACVPDTFMLQTVPEATKKSNGDPAGEFNDNPSGKRSGKKVTNFKKEPRPTDFFTKAYLVQQGLDADNVRGVNNSGYMRESPSELMGFSSKGRRITETGADFLTTYGEQLQNPDTADKKIIDGLLGPNARRKGHSITLDDGDINGASNQIRLRTSTGHQILMNDSEGVIYVGNSTGSVWIELSNMGTMDVYAQDSINFRSNHINFHADGNIKFHSKGYTQVVSEQQLHLEGKQELTQFSEGEIGINGKKNLHLFSESELFATSNGASYYNAGGNISVAGSLVLLQGPKNQAKQAKKIKTEEKEDTTLNPQLGTFALDEEQLLTTSVDRVTMHEPFLYHSQAVVPTPFSGGLGGKSGAPTGGYSIAPQEVTTQTTVKETTTVPSNGTTTTTAPSNTSAIASTTPTSPKQFAGGASSVQGADLNKYIKGADGKITKAVNEMNAKLPGAVAELQNKLPGVAAEFNKALPAAQDQLKSVLNSPQLQNFPVTDMLKQVDTGFSVGALSSIDTQALNAAVVNASGSLNNPQFIDSVTKSVGKYGANVGQLVEQGFVRPEAVFNDQLSDTSLWTGKGGATSLNKFLGNEGLQDSVQQAVTATDYQKLVNTGGIKLSDGKEEIISMLTASNMASPEIVSQVRQGFNDIEGVLQNTTNIPTGTDIASSVKSAMLKGSAAAKRSQQIFADKFASLPSQDEILSQVSAQISGPEFDIATKQLEMFIQQADLPPEVQKKFNEGILALYAKLDELEDVDRIADD